MRRLINASYVGLNINDYLRVMDMSEDVLHFIWEHRLFSQTKLTTLSGKNIHIHKVGIHNRHAGPDFETAYLSIDGTEWIGNVEIHLRSSDWNMHKHQYDKAYDNVVLHVVHEHDYEVLRNDGTQPETLVIGPLIQEGVLTNYRAMMNNLHWIPCDKLIHHIPPLYVQQWLSRILIDRLMKKTEMVLQLVDQYRGDWEEVCYIITARNFGFKTNSNAFEILARSLPQRLIAKNKNNLFTIEALLFGQAGMLSHREFEEEYPSLLKKEYEYLHKAYNIKPMEETVWKFMRMRPSNFPSMRIAQFAALCFSSSHLFTKIIETEDINLCREWFAILPVNDFWKSHYHFHKSSSSIHGNQLGRSAVNNLLLNTIAVLLFAYGIYIDNQVYIQRAIELLESLPPEQNSIIREFDKLNVRSMNAADTQAILHLKTIYCDRKRCLNCGVGLQIIKRIKDDE